MNLERGADETGVAQAVRDVLRAGWEERSPWLVDGVHRRELRQEMWETVTGLGWATMMIEASPGEAMGLDEVFAVHYALGYAACHLPLIPATLVAAAIRGADVDAVTRCRDALDGGSRPAIAMPVRPATTADVAIWTGVRWAAGSDQLIVLLGSDKGPVECWSVHAAGPGIELRPREDVADSDTADVVLRHDWEGELLASLSTDDIDRLSAFATLLEVAELIGAARRALELTALHAHARTQFGQPIGTFQSARHRLADMLGSVEAMYWTARRCMAQWRDAGDAMDLRVVSRLASFVVRTSPRVLADAHQLHGGTGFMLEHPLPHLWRRHRAGLLSLGPANRFDEWAAQCGSTGRSERTPFPCPL